MKGFQILGCNFLLILISVSAFGQSYSIPEIEVDVSISDSGIIEIREHRTYSFDGEFSWADYRLPKEGFTEIQNIQVSTGDSSYVNVNSEEPGTFSVSESSSAIEIKWHYQASDTTKTFTLSYELIDAVAVGAQWSEFNWNYLSSGREKSTEHFRSTIRFPGNTSVDSLYSWTRNNPQKFEILTSDRFIEFSGNSISRRESAELRILFPTSLFNQTRVEITHPDLTLELVQRQEEEYQREAEKKAEQDAFYAEITPATTTLLSLFSILTFIVIYRRYGKRFPSGTHSGRDTLVIPGQHPPALIGRLMVSQQTTSNHLVATLFDLARRGWFKITEHEKEENGWLSSKSSEFKVTLQNNTPDDNLNSVEKMVVEFVKERLSEGINTFEKLFEGSDSTVTKWYSKWVKQVKNEFKKMQWIDYSSYTGVYINVAVQLVLLICAIILLIYGTEVALIAIGVVAFAMIASFSIIRRTEKGENIYREWKAYRDGLKNADERTIRMEILDRHFIFATAFHLSKKELETLLESTNESAHLFPWIVLMHGSSTNAASMASSMSTLAASGSTSFSGTTGAGTGASVGAAGGGASGGAG